MEYRGVESGAGRASPQQTPGPSGKKNSRAWRRELGEQSVVVGEQMLAMLMLAMAHICM